ncbi:MAG TPA: hypothetical protein VFT64_07685 [Rickettsiales bacterium]|nr:hypothetical protein [Rickettsiales bacterium]
MLEGSAGGNKNYTLLYTLGGRIMQMDDDIRPYEIAAANTRDTSYREDTCTWETTEIQCQEGSDVYESLKDFDPMQSRQRMIRHLGKDILQIKPEQYPFPQERRLSYSTYDTAGAFFSALGMPLNELEKQSSQPRYGSAICLDQGDVFTTNDVDWRTNNGTGSITSFLPFVSLLFGERYSIDKHSEQEIDLFSTNKTAELKSQRINVPAPEPSRNPVIRFVNSALTGSFDDDATAHYGDATAPQNITIMNKHSQHPAVAQRCLSILSGVLGIDNRGRGIGPNVKNLRIDDWGYRYESLRPDTMTMQLPCGLTHIRSPERNSLLRDTYNEMLGAIVKVLLLDGRDDQGHFSNLSKRYTPEMANQLLMVVAAYHKHFSPHSDIQKDEAFVTLFKNGKLKEFYKSTAAEINYEIELFRVMTDVWPNLQRAVKQNRDRMPLHNLKTGEQVTMAEISSPEYRQERDYSTEFSFSYPNHTISSSQQDRTKFTDRAASSRTDNSPSPS